MLKTWFFSTFEGLSISLPQIGQCTIWHQPLHWMNVKNKKLINRKLATAAISRLILSQRKYHGTVNLN
jgi:hypothetical protein